MNRTVNFYLGPATGLSSRALTITRMARSGDDPANITPAVDVSLSGSATTSAQELAEDEMFQAVLVDTTTEGVVGTPQVLNFQTGDSQMPGPSVSPTDSLFRVVSVETASSSSSSSSGA